MVAGGLMTRDEAGIAEVCKQTDPLHAQKVVDFATVGGAGVVGVGVWSGRGVGMT